MEKRIFNPSAERLDAPGTIDLAYPIVQDYPLPPQIERALKKSVRDVTRYPHREAEVRKALAVYAGVEPENVLLTVGANGALDLVAQLWGQERRFLVPRPAFWQLVEAPKRRGAIVSHVELSDSDDGRDALLGAFAASDAIVLCSPNNPLGERFDPSLLQELLHCAAGRPVIVDESYADMDEPPKLGAIHPDLVIVRSFKAFLIPGVRVGYILASQDRIQALARLRPPFEGGVFGEAAILACLEHLSAIREIWGKVRADLRYLEGGLRRLGGVVCPSRTLFCAWRHEAALPIGRALAHEKIFVIFADRPVISGMPSNLMRLTARRRDVADTVLAAIERLLPKRSGL